MTTAHLATTAVHRTVPADSNSLPEAWTRRCVDVALGGAIFAVPCCLGGRIALGHCVLSACAVLAALGWAAHLLVARRPTWTVTWAEPLLLAVLGLLLLQITPLPSSLLHILSPRLQDLLPLWSGSTDGAPALGTWHTLSLQISESRSALMTAVSYVVLFYVGVQRMQRIGDVERMLKWIACAAAGMAVFGIVQWLSNNGKFFWFYDYPLTTSGHRLKGAFTNRNHFAQFLALGCGPLVWWIARVLDERSKNAARFSESTKSAGHRDTMLAILLLSLGVVIFAVLFSLSRGGMLALGVALLVILGVMARAGDLSGRVVAGLLATTVACAGFFLMFGFDKFSERLDNWQSDLRLAIWQANLEIFQDFPLFGTGVGSHVEAYRMYFDPPFRETEFTHAESSVLQVASETGLAGLSLALLIWSSCGLWCCRVLRANSDRRTRILAAAISASLAANALHAIFDFVWYVPGLMTVLLLLAACARRLDQLTPAPVLPTRGINRSGAAPTKTHSKPADAATRLIPRWSGLVVGAATLCGAWWAVPQLSQQLRAEPFWFDYINLVLRPDSTDSSDEAMTADAELTADAEPNSVDDERRELERFKQRVAALNQTVKWNPSHARAHARLATSYMRAFEHLQEQSENPMTLSQLRDAALASQFASVADMRAWLQRAVGTNFRYLEAAGRHARRAVQICPLQGLAYVHLAELQFLETLDPGQPKAFFQQAQLVRPHNAQVQFVAGREALLEGRLEDALALWKSAFHQDQGPREQILNLLIGNAPVRLILDHLQPDLAALERLESSYRELLPAEYTAVARAYADALKAELARPNCERPVERLLAAAAVSARLRDRPSAEACYRRALEADGSSFAVHYAYGLFLHDQQDFTSALEQLNWCLRVKPQDAELQRLAESARSRGLPNNRTVLPAEYRLKRS